ncbi:cellulase family glycosylhydrolase [Aquimarina algicola]|uniref:cellulase n=1 Tax=Aquimarina algicola TaxID=2589995 RepID=A0A504JLV7_9FLAO|nr:cellulase family glycosylhydrolase [Aquimarina algicola]TPN87769.1 PKD domain-containing protein [Aquimarina algicola]
MKRLINYIILALLFSNAMTLIAQQQNFLSTSGNKLFDTTGKEVRLTGVNWFGFETQTYFPHGIWTRDMKSVLQQIKDLGFNTIRVPWCNEMLNPGVTIEVNSFGTDSYTGVSPMNAEESKVTTPIELMDIMVKWCQENDIKIVLDNHSRAADGFLNEALWYTDEYSEERWINDWIFMADRYKEYSAVVGMDLNNEPHGSTWGDNDPATNWNKAAERCGNAILKVNPNVLIIVEGVGEFEGNSYWWGGQLMGARQYPVQLSDPSKLVYSAHEYGPEVAPQDWFEAADFPSNMPGIWQENFHYLYEDETSPIFVGEFGIKDQDAFGGISLTWITEWMKFMGDIYSWTFWTMNPNSGDTGGILADDWSTVNEWKMDLLRPYFAPRIPNVIGGNSNNAPIAKISVDTSSGNAPLTVQFDASASSDADGDTLIYSWDFDDTTTDTGSLVSHTFTTPGEYNVVLTVNDGTVTDTETIIINVNGSGTPTVTAVISSDNTSGIAPLLVNFDASTSSSTDNSALTYTWDFGDGTAGSGTTVSHSYDSVGGYIVTLTATSPSGITDTETITITVTEQTSADLVVEYLDGGSGNSNDSAINPHFRIINNGNQEFAYSDITIRYWFTSEENNILNFWCDWAQLGTEFVNGSFGQVSGIDFVEVSFDNTAGVLKGLSNSGAIQTRFAKTNWSAFDETNDYSYDDTKTSFTSHDRVTLYVNGSLVWGIEPANTAFANTMKKTSIEAFPNPVTTQLNLTSNDNLKGAVINIINLSGKIMSSQHIKTSDTKIAIDMAKLIPGIYFVEIIQNGNTIIKQIAK